MHESTISRVTTNKYMHTPRGIFELKYFFNSAINRVDGDTIASESVRNRIQELVSHENPHKPLSDQKLVTILKNYDINIARRTVAKYREMLNIPSSSKRKQVF
jgi:RNA polymerase sigma-54 factor